MNEQQFYGQVRTLVAAACGFFVGNNMLDSSLVEPLSGVIGVVAVGFWSWLAKRNAK